MKLPEQDHLDRVDARLGEVQEALDGVHRITYQAGISRLLAGRFDSDAVRAEHERMVEEQAEGYKTAIQRLRVAAQGAVKWTGDELKALD